MITQTILHGDSTILFPSASQFDVLIADPPYSHHVHKSAISCSGKRGTRKRELGFDSLTEAFRTYVTKCAAEVKRWGVIYSDVESVGSMKASMESGGATYIRTIPWVRWSMPQLSGDRPTTGWEALLVSLGADCDDIVLSWGAKGGRKHWNGPGNLTHLAHKCLRGEGKHKAEKPLDQALDLVDWFSNEGETVFDPCAGSGTIGLACKILGRNYVGVELSAKWAEFASARIGQPGGERDLSKRDRDRLVRWQMSRGKIV